MHKSLLVKYTFVSKSCGMCTFSSHFDNQRIAESFVVVEMNLVCVCTERVKFVTHRKFSRVWYKKSLSLLTIKKPEIE